jgi:hypothetical protein
MIAAEAERFTDRLRTGEAGLAENAPPVCDLGRV